MLLLLADLQRMSGIATATAAFVEAAKARGGAKILETRKTAPGLRLLDKWAVLIGGCAQSQVEKSNKRPTRALRVSRAATPAAGGGHNHRMGLYDMMMIKDNHVTAAGGITAAVARAEAYIADKVG